MYLRTRQNRTSFEEYPQSITITLSPKYNKIIRDYCRQNNIPVSRFIKEIVEKHLLDLFENVNYNNN